MATHMPQKILVRQPHLQAGMDTHTGPPIQGVFGPLWPAGSSSADEARVCTVFNRCVSAGRQMPMFWVSQVVSFRRGNRVWIWEHDSAFYKPSQSSCDLKAGTHKIAAQQETCRHVTMKAGDLLIGSQLR